MKKIRVLSSPITLPAGSKFVPNPDQLKRRRRFMTAIDAAIGLYQLWKSTQFKAGEVIEVHEIDIPKSLSNKVEVLESDDDIAPEDSEPVDLSSNEENDSSLEGLSRFKA